MPDTAGDPLLTLTEAGLFCPAAGVHIDPWRPVARAVVTHAHADHARPGHGAYLCTPGTLAVLRLRLGDVPAQTLAYGRELALGPVTLSFHPAGHVPGSAQVRLAASGAVGVVSGDYKTVADGLSEPFEPVACDVFVSECTFGLPVFRWPDPGAEMARIRAWWRECADAGRVPVLGAYGLGKAQRLIAALAGSGPGPILTHAAVEAPTAALRAAGYALPATLPLGPHCRPADHPGALVIAPPAALAAGGAVAAGAVSTGFASGWMALRGQRRGGAERGFVISDHADWEGLNRAVAATGAARVLLMHGYCAAFARWLAGRGIDAAVLAEAGAGGRGDARAAPWADGGGG